MKTSIFTLKFLVITFLAILSAACAPITTPKGLENEPDISRDLYTRLEQIGVPVKSVQVVNKNPLDLQISIHSSSSDTSMSIDDLWFRALTIRETAMSYQYGYQINSYTLMILDKEDNLISSERTFIDATELSQRLSKTRTATLDNASTQNLIANQIDLHGMSMDGFSVISGNPAFKNGQLLNVNLKVDNLEIANKAIPAFVVSLRPFLSGINSNPSSHISMARIRVHDPAFKLLLDYIWDLDLDKEMFYLAEGIEPWFPKPRPTSTPIPPFVLTQMALPTHTPNYSPQQAYPISSPTPRRPYP